MSDDRPQHGTERADDESVERALRRRFGAALADTATWSDPDPALADAVLARIAAERRLDGSMRGAPTGRVEGAARTPRPTPPVPSAPRVPRTTFSRRLWLAAAAAAAVVAVGIGTLLTRSGDDGGDVEQLAIDGTELAPEASADAAVEELAAGVAIRLQVRDLPPAPQRAFYQGWVRNDAGDIVSVGTFHMRGGDDVVTLWSGVDLDDYPVLSITLQREGEGTDSSGEVVLTGRLTD